MKSNVKTKLPVRSKAHNRKIGLALKAYHAAKKAPVGATRKQKGKRAHGG